MLTNQIRQRAALGEDQLPVILAQLPLRPGGPDPLTRPLPQPPRPHHAGQPRGAAPAGRSAEHDALERAVAGDPTVDAEQTQQVPRSLGPAAVLREVDAELE